MNPNPIQQFARAMEESSNVLLPPQERESATKQARALREAAEVEANYLRSFTPRRLTAGQKRALALADQYKL